MRKVAIVTGSAVNIGKSMAEVLVGQWLYVIINISL
jgi:NAD(P)-dependent dehydrogenase (short-subunit alcohol dehydrogenase family)